MPDDATDPGILALCLEANTRDEVSQKAAWDELQCYRTEALKAAKDGEGVIERELRVALARGRLKTRLQKLLGK